MSKPITIPTNCNPYIVVINNHVYAYRAGDSVEVPDEVAEVIENALELDPKPKRYISQLAQIAEESLTEITAEDLKGISTISNCAFYSCKSLTRVTIPNGITRIGNNAFDWCTALKKIYLPEIPPELTNSNAFGTVAMADRTFYCKNQASLDAYLSAPAWSEVAVLANFAVES